MTHGYLPDECDLVTSPQLATLALLRTAGELTTRALHVEHRDLRDLPHPAVLADSPRLLLASLILVRVQELDDLVASYEATIAAEAPFPEDSGQFPDF